MAMRRVRPITIIGNGEHGKGTFAAFLGMYLHIETVSSVSMWMAEHVTKVILGHTDDTWADLKPDEAAEEVNLQFMARHSKRQEWRSIIDEYRKGDPARIIREMVDGGVEIIDGLRPIAEFEAAKNEGLLGLVIYIKRPGWRDDPTFEISESHADVLLVNDGSVDSLQNSAKTVAQLISYFSDQDGSRR